MFLKDFVTVGTGRAFNLAATKIKITYCCNNNNTNDCGPGWGRIFPPQFQPPYFDWPRVAATPVLGFRYSDF
ncbi:MAG: hypothetical protein ACJAUG_002060 [Halioglobus sp.]